MADATLYVTDEPCQGCIRMIVGTHIRRVVWPDGIAQVVNGRFLKERL
jgi:deoxycytidylate deaminase